MVVGVAEDGVVVSVVGELANEIVQRAGQVQGLGAQHDPCSRVVVRDLVSGQSGQFGQWLSEEEQ